MIYNKTYNYNCPSCGSSIEDKWDENVYFFIDNNMKGNCSLFNSMCWNCHIGLYIYVVKRKLVAKLTDY